MEVNEYSLGIRKDYVIYLQFLWSFLFLLENFFLKRYCFWCVFGFMLDYLKLHRTIHFVFSKFSYVRFHDEEFTLVGSRIVSELKL